MSSEPELQVAEPQLAGKRVFLSSSIPDPTRWDGFFDALEITDAVVAATQAVLTAGGTLVTAAHPTIAPLLLYVASELAFERSPSIAIYQSSLFADVLPEATQRFQDEGIAELTWTPPAPGDEPMPGRWDSSLRTMRETMMTERQPVAAIFIGGMEGILTEYELFRSLFPERPVYAIGRAGGEAQRLNADFETSLAGELQDGDVYPALFRQVIADIAHQSLG